MATLCAVDLVVATSFYNNYISFLFLLAIFFWGVIFFFFWLLFFLLILCLKLGLRCVYSNPNYN